MNSPVTSPDPLTAPASVIGPGWVDQRTTPIMGLFPLSVERHVNGAVADHAFGVTTVTRAAQYYALHGLIADEATKEGLTNEAARCLLRRVEVVYAAACLAHESAPEHPSSGAIDPHGADFLRPLLATGAVDLRAMTTPGPGTYAQAGWGFAGAYRGSELVLGVLQSATTTGPKYDSIQVRQALAPLLALARQDSIDLIAASAIRGLCLCQTSVAPNADWLAGLFTGDVSKTGTQAAVLGQTAALIKSAISNATVKTEDDLRNYICYPEQVDEESTVREFNIYRRWRGIVLRSKAVEAWRELWGMLSDQIAVGGTSSRDELAEWLASAMPSVPLRTFVNQLPRTSSVSGACLPAEIDQHIQQLPDVQRCLAVLLLSAAREQELQGDEGLGFRGPRGKPEAVEELSPHWVAGQIDAWGDRHMADFGRRLADVLLDRSQRIALRKSRFDYAKGSFTFPARVIVRDGLVFRLYRNGNHRMPLRLAQLLSMGEQTGLYERDSTDGRWLLGARGDLVA